MIHIFIALLMVNLNFIGCAGPGHTDRHPPEVLALTADFKKTMLHCPDRIWSDYSWEGLKVVFVYPSRDQSRIWDVSSDRIDKVDTSTLEPSSLSSFYAFFEWEDGKPTMSLNMEMDYPHEELFRFGVHEFFHNQGQKGWERRQRYRTMAYPFEWEPRLYRRMIFDNLKDYFSYGNQADLRRARYWFDKWSENEYELLSTTDGYEGTAYYVEVLAQGVATLGCQVSDDALKAYVLDRVYADFGHPVSGESFSSALEGYAIGGLAAMILRFREANLSEWNQRMAEGDTPLEVLLEDVTPLAETAPLHLMERFQDTAERSNEAVGALVDEDIGKWDDPDYVRLSVNPGHLKSGFSPALTLRLIEKEIDVYTFGNNHRFFDAASRSNFVIKKDAVVFAYYVEACPTGFFVVLLPKASISPFDGAADVFSDALEGSIEGQSTTDEEGFPFICVQ